MNNEAGSSRSRNETKNCELFLRRAFKAYKAEIQEYKSEIDNLVSSHSTRENSKCQKCEDLQISVQELNKLLKISREKLDEKDRIISNLQLQLREKSTSASFHKSSLKERQKRGLSSDEDVLHIEKENMLTKKLKPNNLKSSPIKARVTIVPETLDLDMAIEDHTNQVLVPETLDMRIETEEGHAHTRVLVPETLDIESEHYSHKASKESFLIPETLQIDFPDCINVKGSSKPLEKDCILSKRILTGDATKHKEDQGIHAPLNTSTPKKRAKTVKNCHESEKTKDIVVTCQDLKVATGSPQSDCATPDSLCSSDRKRPRESHDTNTSNQNKSLNDSSDFFEAALVNLRKNKVQQAKNNKPTRKNLKSTAKKSTGLVVQIEPKKPGHKSPKLIQTKINKDMFTKRRTVLDKDLEAAISESLKDAAKPIANADDVCIITEPSTNCSSNDSEDLLAEMGAVSPKNRNAEGDVKPKVKYPVHLGPYDKVPAEEGPSYKYRQDPIRKKRERAKLNGYMCTECEQFNQALPGELQRKQLQKCSRHKDINDAPPTPVHFWSPNFPSSPECIVRGYNQKTKMGM